MTMLADLAIEDMDDQPSLKRDQQVKDTLAEIVQQGTLCSEIIENMASLTNDQPIDVEHVDINLLIQKALRDIKLQKKKQIREITIRQQLEDTLPVIQADKESIYQLVTNLIANAIEAMQAGNKKMLTVKSSRNDHGVIIAISDTGNGINESEKNKIYEAFHSTKGRNNTGLGLSICKSIVDAHNGMITVNSTRGKGTTFSVFLPYK